MENQPINYREEITKALSFIPDAYLTSLYHIIELIARPFRKEEEENRLDKETLQAYADTFRKGFSLVMKKNVGLSFSYQIQEKFTIFKVYFPDIEEQEAELKEEEFYLDKLCEDNRSRIVYNEEKQGYELEYLEKNEEVIEDKYAEKMLIPDIKNMGIHFIEISAKEKWQPENASDDSRNLFGLLLRMGTIYQKTKTEQSV